MVNSNFIRKGVKMKYNVLFDKNGNELKTVKITMKIKPSDKKKWEKEAKLNGIPLSTYLYESLINYHLLYDEIAE